MGVPTRNSIRDQCSLSVTPVPGGRKLSDACCSAPMVRCSDESARVGVHARTLAVGAGCVGPAPPVGSIGFMLMPRGDTDDAGRQPQEWRGLCRATAVRPRVQPASFDSATSEFSKNDSSPGTTEGFVSDVVR